MNMILDRGSAFLHLLNDIATKDCFKGRALRSCCVAIGISHKAGKTFTQKPGLILISHINTRKPDCPIYHMQDKKQAAWTLTVKQPNQHDKQCDDFCSAQTKASFLELIRGILRTGPQLEELAVLTKSTITVHRQP
jgi:hypothetical protein